MEGWKDILALCYVWYGGNPEIPQTTDIFAW
jgi:hypothetical protein